MPKQTPQTIPQEAFDWYDEYAHGVIDRRTFLNKLATLAGAGLSISLLGAALIPNYALAEQVSFNDPEISASYVTFPSPKGYGEVRGYLVSPKAETKPLGCVLVIHENRGLNPYIEDVARRLAKAGFLALAPDALHSVGGYPGNDDTGRSLQSSLSREKIEFDFLAAAEYLKTHLQGNGKLGAVGFCFGGYIVNMLAARAPELLNAGVPFYGTPAAPELQPAVKAPLLLQFAEQDDRVNSAWPEYEKILQKNNVNYKAHIYKETQHGFHNDSTGRYNEEAAELAWTRTLAFFKEHLLQS